MSYLYRYMSFENFVDFVQRSALCFRHPTKWEDPYEYEPYKYFIHKNLESHVDLGYEQYIKFALETVLGQRVFAQCWTRLAESDAMWKIYSSNKHSVRICVKRNQLNSLGPLAICDVVYTDKYEKYIDNVLCEDIFKSLCVKRKAFKHEEETRVLICDKYESELEQMDEIKTFISGMIIEKFNSAQIELIWNRFLQLFERSNHEKMVEVENLSTFVHSVMLNPFAKPYFSKTVETFCKNNNLNYIGQSQLYCK